MKLDDPSTGPKTEGSCKSTSDAWAWIGNKDYRVIGEKDVKGLAILIIGIQFVVFGFGFLIIQCGMGCSDPDMVLYNNTGGEIEIALGGEFTVVQKDSSGIVEQPAPTVTGKMYKPFSILRVNRKWSYAVVYPPSEYKKRLDSRSEYRYQIEADGSIYLIEPDSEFPAHKLPPQPSGFPWVPKYNKWGESSHIEK